MRSAIWSVLLLASARAAAAEPAAENVELAAVASSPCADAIATLDPQHEIKPAPACKQIQKLEVGGLGTVVLERVATSTPFLPGYMLVLSIVQPTATTWKALAFSSGGCGAGTCVDYKPHGARLLRLTSGDPAFGVEVESLVEVRHTFKDLGPTVTTVEHYRLACASRARVIDCKQIVIGGRGADCRVLGWHGTAIRYSCTDETQLVPVRSADAAGIPQADLERLQELATHVDRTIADNLTDCASMVTQLDKLIARDAEAVALARALVTPASGLPSSFAKQLSASVNRMAGAHTCLENVPVEDALGRLFHAVGLAANFHLHPPP